MMYILISQNWKLEWLFGSMWQMESLALLLVLMWLWQPKDQAQRSVLKAKQVLWSWLFLYPYY